MLGFAVALGAAGLAYALANDKKHQNAATTESGITEGNTSGDVIVNSGHGKPTATMPREGADTAPDEESDGHSGTIIEMPPMIIERGVQKPAVKPTGGKKPPCNCIKAPCGPCGNEQPIATPKAPSVLDTVFKPLKPAAPVNTGIVPPGMKVPPANTGIVPPGMKVPAKGTKPGGVTSPPIMKQPSQSASISIKGLTPAAAGTRIMESGVRMIK